MSNKLILNSRSEYADLYMAAEQLKNEQQKSKESSEFLYPHIQECVRIIVPTINVIESFPVKLIKHTYCQSIFVAFILMNLFKTIFRRIVSRKWDIDIFATLRIFLAQGKETKSKLPKRSWESIWIGLLVTLSLITTALLSALCYKTIVSIQLQKQINTMDDLIKSNLTIFVPKMLASDVEIWRTTLK